MKFPEIEDALKEMQYRNDFEGALCILELLNDISSNDSAGMNLEDIKHLISSAYDSAKKLTIIHEREPEDEIFEFYSGGILDS